MNLVASLLALLAASPLAAALPVSPLKFSGLNAGAVANRHNARWLKVNNPSALGIDTVEQASGYVDSLDGSKHFFYWLFEARHHAASAPLLVWLSGGPGCSSLTGLLFEIGPKIVRDSETPETNPWAWNDFANVLFVDQPIGTGFSTGTEPTDGTTDSASQDFTQFLELFFAEFPQYAFNGVHLGGESYSGHLIPAFARAQLDIGNPFGVRSVLLGNGLVDTLHQFPSFATYACNTSVSNVAPLVDTDTCAALTAAVPNCTAAVQACYNTGDDDTCAEATGFCEQALVEPYAGAGASVYDVRATCDDPDNLCLPQLANVAAYVNGAAVKKALGVPAGLEYVNCNSNVTDAFMGSGDATKNVVKHVAALLERNIGVLVYAGDQDFSCNWLGNDAWTRAVKWCGQHAFQNAPLQPWTLSNGHQAGEARRFGPLKFARVFDAGHLVPYYQPQAAYELAKNWLQHAR